MTDLPPNGIKLWEVAACLERAARFLAPWGKPDTNPSALLHAAFELRLALEAYVMQRYEEITGESPQAHGVPAEALFLELALFNEEAMTPQTWSIGIFEEEKRGNPVTQRALGITLLRFIQARDYYTRLTDLLHTGLQYDPQLELPTFWEKQYLFLQQLHRELSALIEGQTPRSDTPGTLLTPGQEQSGIL
jgi:hypothetical protein